MNGSDASASAASSIGTPRRRAPREPLDPHRDDRQARRRDDGADDDRRRPVPGSRTVHHASAQSAREADRRREARPAPAPADDDHDRLADQRPRRPGRAGRTRRCRPSAASIGATLDRHICSASERAAGMARRTEERDLLNMRRSFVSIGAVIVFALGLSSSATAQTKDYAGTALNIIPSGQYGDLGEPAGYDTQAQMYDGLTPLFDQVTPADLTTYFKSEKFGIDTATPSTVESRPARRRHDRARLLQRPARHRRDPRRRRLGRRLDRRRGPRPAARAGALQRPRRRDRRPGPDRARA